MQGLNADLLVNLPFRVVLNHILPFISRSVEGEDNDDSEDLSDFEEVEESDFELFGYFREDPYRKPFFLFQSLDINGDNISTIIDITRLISLSIHYSKETVKMVKLNSIKFKNLGSLVVGSGGGDEILGIFSKIGSFPSLKSLRISSGTYIGGKLSCNNVPLWKNLETLSLSNSNDYSDEKNIEDFPIFSHPQHFTNLKVLSLCVCSMSQKTIVELPNLTDLYLILTKNLIVIPSGERRPISVFFNCIHSEEMKVMINRIQQLKSIVIKHEQNRTHFENESYEFLIDPKFMETKTRLLELVEFDNIFFDCSILHQPFSINSNKLNSLKINDCFEICKFDEFLTSNTFHHIESLTLSEFWNESFWSVDVEKNTFKFPNVPFRNLKYLFLCSVKRFKNDLFVVNQFPKLEFLSLRFCEQITGLNWTPMSQLKELELVGFKKSHENILFHDERIFPNLEHLRLRSMDRLKERGDSGIFENLRKLTVDRCPISDELFQNNIFRELEELNISKCDAALLRKLRKWKKRRRERRMRKIRKRKTLEYGINYRLKQLKKKDPTIKLMEGKGWNYIPKLKILRVCNCPFFTDVLFQTNHVVNHCLETLVIRDCGNIEEFDWVEFPKLKKKEVND